MQRRSILTVGGLVAVAGGYFLIWPRSRFELILDNHEDEPQDVRIRLHKNDTALIDDMFTVEANTTRDWSFDVAEGDSMHLLVELAPDTPARRNKYLETTIQSNRTTYTIAIDDAFSDGFRIESGSPVTAAGPPTPDDSG